MFRKIALISYFLCLASGDWVSEWMSPIQEHLKETTSKKPNVAFGSLMYDVDNLKMESTAEKAQRTQNLFGERYSERKQKKNDVTLSSLKKMLENTLQNAKMVAEMLKVQIGELQVRENTLKEAIVSGRYGVSSVLVSPIDRPPRAYIVRDGVWTLCTGGVRLSEARYMSVTVPKCLGQEVTDQPDPCVFNSVIKYETVPIVRGLEYSEDEFLCLKQSFNNTLERYMSVPRKIIKDTCQNGVVRSLEDNGAKCGLRVMSEYTYYPSQSYKSILPLEYCAESDGSCKFIMAWHLSNGTVENFEFLKNEEKFKNFFIKSSGYSGYAI